MMGVSCPSGKKFNCKLIFAIFQFPDAGMRVVYLVVVLTLCLNFANPAPTKSEKSKDDN
jgi:hypothetical protein